MKKKHQCTSSRTWAPGRVATGTPGTANVTRGGAAGVKDSEPGERGRLGRGRAKLLGPRAAVAKDSGATSPRTWGPRWAATEGASTAKVPRGGAAEANDDGTRRHQHAPPAPHNANKTQTYFRYPLYYLIIVHCHPDAGPTGGSAHFAPAKKVSLPAVRIELTYAR